VISVLLTALLAANLVTEHVPKSLPKLWIVLPLLVGLGVVYWLPFDRMQGAPAMVGMLAAGIFFVPVVFAGLLFSLEFRDETSPAAALGANVLGAVVGGLLENLSLILGMRGLIPITIAIYCVAAVAVVVRRRRMLQTA
jgi:hypothetical protein